MGPHSTVFRLDAAEWPRPLAVKSCCDPLSGAPDPEFARRQFDEISRAYEAMGDGGTYQVPRPVLMVEEQALILTEWAAGETLAQRLGLWRAPRRQLEAVRHAGAWLRRFHDSRTAPPGPVAARELYGRLEERVRRRTGAARFLLRRALSALAEALPRVERTPVPQTWIHGDFQLDNLVLSREVVSGLDVAYSRVDAALWDVATFLNALEQLLLLPKGLRLCPLRRRLTGAFLDGYAGRAEGGEPEVLNWLRIADLVLSFLWFHDRGRTPLHDWYFRQVVRRLLERLIRERRRWATTTLEGT